MLLVLEELDRQQREPARLLEPAQLAGRLVQLEQPGRDRRVVVQVRVDLRRAGAEAPVQAPALVRERAEQELGDRARRVEVVLAPEPAARLGERRRARVRSTTRAPCRRARAAAAGPAPRAAARAILGRDLAAQDEPPALERQEPVVVPLAEHLLDLRGRPRVGQPFLAVRVRVLRGREAALRQAQLAEHVVERLLDDPPVALLACHRPAVQVRGREERVVVEHLLEVGDEPDLVHGVPVEAAADEVVHAARRHPVERRARHRERVARRRGRAPCAAGTRASRRAGTSARRRSRRARGRRTRRATRPRR